MECPICYDTLKNGYEIITILCNHTFHKNCLKQWFETSISKNKLLNCPYCRTRIPEHIITSKNNLLNKIYKTKYLKRKTCIINNIQTSFILKQLHDQLPKAWLDKRSKNIQPLFELITNNKSIYITSFLRSYLLFTERKDNIILLEKKDFLGDKYYDLEKNCNILGIFTNSNFNICYDWCFDVLNLLSNTYGINYGMFYNTILNDLALNTMKSLNLENKRCMFQAIYTTAMYSLLIKFQHLNKKEAILPNLNKFIYFSNYIYTEEQLQPLIDYQKNYLDNNIILIK